MSYLDSPIGRCEEAHTMVLIDQTQEQCAVEHECPEGRICPLAGCFANAYESYRDHHTAAGADRSAVTGCGDFFMRMRGLDERFVVAPARPH